MRRLIAITCAALFGAASPAQADPVEVTGQAKSARAEFLLRVSPPATPAAVCLVDTGANTNPDTAGVIARLSLPGLDGTDRGPTLHGTLMSMIIGGASNGFGMVGFWPQARIVSVQSNFPDTDSFPIGGYVSGIHRCDVESGLYGIKVIVIAISTESQPTSEEAISLAEAVKTARNHGLNVVVAGGNFNGRPVGTPANVAGAISVGGIDASTGELCTTSSTGALLYAPGCSIDGADPSTGQPTVGHHGTSAAAAMVASAIAAVRTWRPDLSPDAAEQLINASGAMVPYGRRLDLTAAFEAAGLQSVVALPAAPPQPAPAAAQQRLAKPRLTVRSSGRGARRTLRIRVSNRPSRMTMTVRVYRSAGKGKLRRLTTKTVGSSKLTLRVSRRWTRVTAYFKDPSGTLLQSPSAKVSAKR